MFGSKRAIDRIFGGLQRRTQRLGAGETEIGANETEKGAMLVSRRAVAAVAAGGIVAASAAARAGSFGNPGRSAARRDQCAQPGERHGSRARSGACEPIPCAGSPPATDVGDMPRFWATFNNAPKRARTAAGRQVTQADFDRDDDLGVDMRLTAGAIRDFIGISPRNGLHDLRQLRVTVLDPAGHAYVADVRATSLARRSSPFSRGSGRTVRILLAFDTAGADQPQHPSATDWMAHTPPDVLALNFGVPASSFKKIPTHQLYIFQSDLPGPLGADQAAVKSPLGPPPNPFTFSLGSEPYTRDTKGGKVQIADSNNFTVSKTIAAALVTVHPGGLRELHWHPNADEWQYWIKGRGEMTVFTAGPNAVTQDFAPGDIGYVLRGNGHYIKNIGDTDLQFLEIFRSSYFADVSLSDWLTHTPPAMVAAHLNVDVETIKGWPNDKPLVMPE
jgi:oxalate decarboxylase